MIRHDRRSIALAVALASLAGYVDALGFLSFGNFFVSFMSGNSTRLGIGFGNGDFRYAFLACGVVGLFVGGVVLGSLLGDRFPRRKPAVLLFVGALLALAGLLHLVGLTKLGIAAMLLAMGAENTVFQREGEISIGLTYMTGTLVKLGQRLAAVVEGKREASWFPYLLLWLGLILGACLGAVAHTWIGLGGLFLGSVCALIMALASAALRPPHPAGS